MGTKDDGPRTTDHRPRTGRRAWSVVRRPWSSVPPIFPRVLTALFLCATIASAAPSLKLVFDEPRALSGLDLTRTVLAKELPDAPVIDGRLDDPAWRQAAALGEFSRAGAAQPAPLSTRAFVGHRQGILYVGVECDGEPQGAADPAWPLRPWAGDGLLLLLDETNDRRSLGVIAASPHGQLSDYAIAQGARDVNWRSGGRGAVARTETGWSAEFALPRAGRVPNDLIGFNIIRRVPGAEGDPYAWNPVSADFENGEHLGVLSFETRPCSIQQIRVGWPRVGANQFRLVIRNGADQPQELRAGMATARSERSVDRSRYRFVVPASQAIEIALSHRIAAPGPCDMEFALFEEKTGRVIAQFTRKGLPVIADALTLEPLHPGEAPGEWKGRFAAFLPAGEAAELTLNATLRESGTLRVLAQDESKPPASRSGDVDIMAADLPPGKYLVRLTLMRGPVQMARVDAELILP